MVLCPHAGGTQDGDQALELPERQGGGGVGFGDFAGKPGDGGVEVGIVPGECANGFDPGVAPYGRR